MEWLVESADGYFKDHHNPKDMFEIEDYRPEDEADWHNNWKPQIESLIEDFK
ncbi:hypothetical protein [Xylocopilactobacillus apicola]|uniref:Uncharacterized protein n=1 Tax=Xylocopilactobacillus apicola TaxID=2932184 RepID=A0AAU9DA01_9LACO|nr:hypothetical protein [Xylocopilactobacillus apicola]BDR59261.1 hypothetical protein XA3_17020 [Xylocopilactobacillus apicola]